MEPKIKNKTASIKAKLLNLARIQNIDFDTVLLRFFQERFLYRLSICEFSERFVLKGGLLLLCLKMPQSRPTKDIDFLAQQIKNNTDELENIFKKITLINCNDGVTFDPVTIKSERIKEDADYEGIRMKISANLGKIRKMLQVDIGFGDIVIPKTTHMDFPVLLDNEPPKINVYSLESVVAEKFEAMVKLSMVNSRMKDFYDVYMLAMNHNFRSDVLQEAIAATFRVRKTPLPNNPLVFKDEFITGQDKQQQWKAFLRRIKVADAEQDFSEIMKKITKFLKPVVTSMRNNIAIKENWDTLSGDWMKQ